MERVSRLVTRSLHRVVTEEGLVIGSRKRNVLGVIVDACRVKRGRRGRGNDVQDRRAVKATGG